MSDQPIRRNEILNVDPHTVFMTVGPSKCGKTTFCTQYLRSALPGKVIYLSSNDLRHDLMDNLYPNGSKEMISMSHLAFEQLFSRLSAYMTWPCSAEFIIIDTNGLNESFRRQITNLCNEKCYNLVPILFEFKSYDDYFTYTSDRRLVTRHIDKFRSQVLPRITREFKGSRILFIKHHDFGRYKINVPEWENYSRCFISPENKPIVIGNLNGCYDELRLLLQSFKLRFEEDGIQLKTPHTIILVGNPFNKSDVDIKIIDFIRRNTVYCVCDEVTPYDEIINRIPFASVRYRWIVTAHFMEKKYLQKLPRENKFMQRGYLQQNHDGVYDEPLRIFGSFPTQKCERKDNLLAIDGGCVHGGTLYGITFSMDQNPIIKCQAAQQIYEPGTLNNLFSYEIELKTYDDLSPPMQYRYNKIIHAAAPFLSGTMSPAPADKQSEIITPECFESLSQGLLHFKHYQVSHVCLQPKYMGSRCTIILNRDASSYAISRGGFSIRIPGIKNVLSSLESKYLIGDVMTAIIDGELLPWTAMSRSLVDNTFGIVDRGIKSDIEGLRKYGFNDVLSQLANNRSEIKVPLTKNNAKTIGQGIYHTMIVYDEFMSKWVGIDALAHGSSIYSEQLALFSEDGPLEYKPFALLKTVHENGTEHIYHERSSVNFQRVSDDAHVVVSVDDLPSAQAFYDLITKERQMEGIVIKPETTQLRRAVPYMKVRNRNYLTLTYGPTYQHQQRLEQLVQKKKVSMKQKLSRLQHWISREILQIPFKQLGPSNERYCNLVATFLKSNEEEEKVDPRL
jgi:predicted kinase